MIDLFTPHPGLSSNQRQQVARVFAAVIEAYEPLQNHRPYKQVTHLLPMRQIQLTVRHVSQDECLSIKSFLSLKLRIQCGASYSLSYLSYASSFCCYFVVIRVALTSRIDFYRYSHGRTLQSNVVTSNSCVVKAIGCTSTCTPCHHGDLLALAI